MTTRALAGVLTAIAAAFAVAAPASAQQSTTLDVDFTRNSLRASVGQVTDHETFEDTGTRSAFDAGFVAREDSHRGVYAGAYVMGSVANLPLTGGVGPRAWVVSTDRVEGVAGTLGGYGRWSVPQIEELAVRLDAFASPPIMALGPVDYLYELSGRVEYRLFPEAAAYGGLRRIDVEGKGDTVTVDDGVMFGLSLEF